MVTTPTLTAPTPPAPGAPLADRTADRTAVPGRRVPFERRRQLPWVAAGVVLVVGCALLFALITVRGSSARQVLVVTTDLPAGHVLTPADLTTTALTQLSVASVPAAEAAAEVGRPLAVPLLAGALLTPAAVGSSAPVSAGQAIVGLALKAGQYPPMLGPGDQVQIIDTTPVSTDGDPAPDAVSATVVGVSGTPEGSSADAVVSVQVSEADAAGVARSAAAGQATLVLLPPGSTS